MGIKGNRNKNKNTIEVTVKKERSTKHHELCCLVAKKFFKREFNPFGMYNTRYVVVEFYTQNGEYPDVFGFGGNYSQLFEIKLSHSDFLKDNKKKCRNDFKGIGEFRTYVCPTGIIKKKELPINWGLLYYDEKKGIFTCEQRPEQMVTDYRMELNIAMSIMRREGIKSKVFNYRKI
jgi:hypothetical protein